MLAEEHRIVARGFRIEQTVPVPIRLDIAISGNVVAVAVRPVIHCLDAARVAVEGGIVCEGASAGVIAEKVRRHVLHSVQAEAIAFGGVERPHGRAREVGFNIFRHGLAVGSVEAVP